MSKDLSFIQKRVTKSKISFASLLLFAWKTLFFEKAAIVINAICLASSLIFSFLFQLYYKTQDEVIIIFNYYFIFYVLILLFVLSLRMCLIFWDNKINDKTVLNLIITNSSRTNIFLSFFLCSILSMGLIIFCSALLIIIPELIINHSFSSILVINTCILSLYALALMSLLIAFITFTLLFLNKNIALMISVLLLTFQFISAIPQKFQKEKEAGIFLSFNDGTSMSGEKIRNAFDLQKSILDNNIKFPNLARYINDTFIENKFKKGQSFIADDIVLLRKNIWDSLGLGNDSIISTGDLLDNQYINRIPNGWTGWNAGTKVKLNFIIKDDFINFEGLTNLLTTTTDASQKAILQELSDFIKYIQSFFASPYEFKKEFLGQFDSFITVQNSCSITNGTGCEDTSSYIEKLDGSGTQRGLTTNELESMYQNYYLDVHSGMTLDQTSEVTKFVTNDIFNAVRLGIRILENYFIESTSDYIFLALQDASGNYHQVQQNDKWKEFKASEITNNLLYLLNPLAWTQSIYTTYAKESAADIWYEYKNTSNILFYKQNNLFLTYPRYLIELDENNVIAADTYNNVYDVWIFMIVLAVILLLFVSLSIDKFNRMDLK